MTWEGARGETRSPRFSKQQPAAARPGPGGPSGAGAPAHPDAWRGFRKFTTALQGACLSKSVSSHGQVVALMNGTAEPSIKGQRKITLICIQ